MWQESDCSKCVKEEYCKAKEMDIKCCPFYETEAEAYMNSGKYRAYDRMMKDNKGIRIEE